MSSTIDPSLLLSNYNRPERKTGQQVLGKDDFLKILLVQLQNQDPMNPLEDKEFISQMANFSALEQMTNMTKMMEQFIALQRENSVLRFSEMIGKVVHWEELQSEEMIAGSGKVKSVLQRNNEIMLELDNGKTISSKQITKVEAP